LGEKEKNRKNNIFENFNIYSKIAKLDDLEKGKTFQQKTIKRLLRRIEILTESNFSAFFESFFFFL
jgi:hypothetical protein